MIERNEVIKLIRRTIAEADVEMRVAASKGDYSTAVNCQAGIVELELLLDDVDGLPEVNL